MTIYDVATASLQTELVQAGSLQYDVPYKQHACVQSHRKAQYSVATAATAAGGSALHFIPGSHMIAWMC